MQISVPAFTAEEQSRLVELVTDNPLFLSKLLNRELPSELNEACLARHIHIFPDSWDDLKGSCSCPDWAVPCKHMAAVLFIIANEIDKNPFVVFDLHRFDLVAALRDSGFTEESGESVPITRLSVLQQPLTDSEPAAFVPDENLFAALDFSLIPDCRERTLRLLSEKPVFYPEGDFKKILTAALKEIAAGVEKTAPVIGDLDAEMLHVLRATDKVNLFLDQESAGLISCNLLDQEDDMLHTLNSTAELSAFLESLPAAELAFSSPDLRSIDLAYRFAKILARQSAFVPQILGTDLAGKAAYLIRYLPAIQHEEIRVLYENIRQLQAPELLFYVGETQTLEPVSSDCLNALLSLFLGHFVRVNAVKAMQMDEVPRWFFSGNPTVFDQFANREYPKSIQLWISRFYIAEKEFTPVFEITEDAGHFEVAVSIEDKKAVLKAPVPLKNLFSDKQFAKTRLELLRDLSMVAEFFPPISRLISSKGVEKLTFDSHSFVSVFFDALPVIRLFGIRVLMPKSLQKMLRPAMSLSLSASNKGKAVGAGLLSFAELLNFEWQIAMGDQMMSPQEFLKMVKNMRGIVRLADGYAYLDEKEIAALLDKIDRSPAPSGPKLLQIALSEEYNGAPVVLDQAAQNLMAELLRPDAAPIPRGIQANLRPYQLRGYEWLYKNARLGLGCLIADDMGLGKTLQIITLLQKLKEDGAINDTQKALVIVPTTLLTNWSKELARFAPELRAHVYHGSGRKMAPLADFDILLSTYGVARTETAVLQKHNWQIAIVDEAQNIKNSETAQTKAVKKIKATVRIAMSGTPVENRLSEYYSILEFANQGYLGNPKQFMDEFAKPIEVERNHVALERFRRVTSPFLLRRMKTDKSIITDLPDKIETDQYCHLTAEQAALYQNVVDASFKALNEPGNDHIKRQGLVLKMLTALKQVCNHPAHYLKKGKAEPALSGKTRLLLDLLAQILESGEKALIFTQYQEMGDLLVPLLREELGLEAAFLHGGVDRKGRDKMVDHFQQNRNARVLILSLKAGGTGLNLTAASNVIHFDLWWNPAVEAQATDRAFRIGQQKNVQVHRFITQGSFEEKINQMLQSKKELANLSVVSGEKWVGDLSDAELKDLVLLK